MYKIPEFIGPFKDILPNFINYRRSLGYDYQKPTVLRFKELDTFLSKYGYNKIEMTREMYDLWIAKRGNETHTNQGKRCSAFTTLAKYLTSIGYDNIFCLHLLIIECGNQILFHIFFRVMKLQIFSELQIKLIT